MDRKRARCRLERFGENPEQRRFTGAVAPDDSPSLAFCDGECDAGKQDGGTESNTEVRCRDESQLVIGGSESAKRKLPRLCDEVVITEATVMLFFYKPEAGCFINSPS